MESIEQLIGKTIIKIEGMEAESDEIIFSTSDGLKYRMYHDQDCCESVSLDDVCGDVSDLLNSPVLKAEEFSNIETAERGPKYKYDDSYTWTFYHLATIKGYVDLRWYGTSNGCYSESVDFEMIK